MEIICRVFGVWGVCSSSHFPVGSFVLFVALLYQPGHRLRHLGPKALPFESTPPERATLGNNELSFSRPKGFRECGPPRWMKEKEKNKEKGTSAFRADRLGGRYQDRRGQERAPTAPNRLSTGQSPNGLAGRIDNNNRILHPSCHRVRAALISLS